MSAESESVRCSEHRSSHFFGRDTKVDQDIRTECEGQRHIGCIPAAGDQNPTDPWIIVAWVKRVPAPAQKDFNPGRKILRRMRRRKSDVADVACAIASRDIEAPAECKSEMSIVATHTLLFLKRLGSCARWPRVLVAKGDMIVHIVADGLHASPSWRSFS